MAAAFRSSRRRRPTSYLSATRNRTLYGYYCSSIIYSHPARPPACSSTAAIVFESLAHDLIKPKPPPQPAHAHFYAAASADSCGRRKRGGCTRRVRSHSAAVNTCLHVYAVVHHIQGGGGKREILNATRLQCCFKVKCHRGQVCFAASLPPQDNLFYDDCRR